MASNEDKTPTAAAKQPVNAHGDAAFPYAKKGHAIVGVRRPHPGRWKHEAAAALHDWAACAHHTAKEMELSDADYVKALAAACTPDKKGNYTPHKPAFYAVPTPKA